MSAFVKTVFRGGVFRTSPFPAYRFVCQCMQTRNVELVEWPVTTHVFRYTLNHFKQRKRTWFFAIFRNLQTKVTKYNNKGIRSCTLLADFNVFARWLSKCYDLGQEESELKRIRIKGYIVGRKLTTNLLFGTIKMIFIHLSGLRWNTNSNNDWRKKKEM